MPSTGEVLVGVLAALRSLFNVLFGALGLVFSGYYLASAWGGFVVLMAALKFVFGIAYAFAAIGLLGERSWARLVTLIAFGLTTIYRLVTIALVPVGILTFVWLVLDIVIIGWCLTSQPTRRNRSSAPERLIT